MGDQAGPNDIDNFLTEIGGWQELVPATATYDDNGVAKPLKEHPFFKESKDFGGFVTKAFDAHREVGSRIPVRKAADAAASEAWRKENLPKLYEAGLLDRPPADPKEYGITKPTDIGSFTWSDELGMELGGILHKFGVPKDAAPELLDLHKRALEHGRQALKTDMETATASLKKEFGDKYEPLVEEAKRLTKMIFSTPEEIDFFNETGLADHPRFLGVLMRLAPLAQQDSSFIADMSRNGGVGSMTPEQAAAEHRDIATNKENPRHAKFLLNDKEVSDYIDNLYKKAHGTGTTTV